MDGPSLGAHLGDGGGGRCGDFTPSLFCPWRGGEGGGEEGEVFDGRGLPITVSTSVPGGSISPSLASPSSPTDLGRGCARLPLWLSNATFSLPGDGSYTFGGRCPPCASGRWWWRLHAGSASGWRPPWRIWAAAVAAADGVRAANFFFRPLFFNQTVIIFFLTWLNSLSENARRLIVYR